MHESVVTPDLIRSRGIEPERLQRFVAYERERFEIMRPRSATAATSGDHGYYAGVPLHWMLDWPLPFPLVIAQAVGATLTDIDGIELADFCLGDTGSMFGHSPEPVARALMRQAERGFTYMLPSEDTGRVGELLRAHFGMAHWQIATTASDANRFALRLARAVTGRRRILVIHGCYHGAVDETYVALVDGRAKNRAGLIGQYADLTKDTAVVEFNDLPALEAALASREIACVITEPVLTNCSMVLPVPGYHAALRKLTRDAGTLLLIDETHTISCGLGGYSRQHGLEPDIFVIGKPIAGGLPASAWGFTEAIGRAWDRIRSTKPEGHSGLGTTLSGNALVMATMRATLTEVMTEQSFAHMDQLASVLASGLSVAIDRHRLPWHVVRVGGRVEFICAAGPLRNGTDALAAHAAPIEHAIHLGLLNRGTLITPFHNMMLVCPATTRAQVDRLVSGFDNVLAELRRA